MTTWPALDARQQNDLLEKMTATLLSVLPPGWRELLIDFRAVGRNIDVSVGNLDADGEYQVWDPPAEFWRMFQRLRGGMYRPNEGTWFSARYRLEPPSRFSIQYNWTNEPAFQPRPAPDDFAVEQERFPRDEQFMPAWYRKQLNAQTH